MLNLRPAALFRWVNPQGVVEEHVADIVLAFSMSPSEPVPAPRGAHKATAFTADEGADSGLPVFMLVQWHKPAKALCVFPHIVTALDNDFSIVPVSDVVCAAKVFLFHTPVSASVLQPPSDMVFPGRMLAGNLLRPFSVG